MIKAFIIDDEEHCTDTLKWQLERSCPDVEIKGIFNDPQKAYEALRLDSPDLVFLDIEMPGMSGFELLKRTSDLGFEVVFTTAYDEFAIKAIKMSALDYLMKPVDKKELVEAVAKTHSRLNEKKSGGKYERLFEIIEGGDNWKERRMPFPTSDGLELVPLGEILRCEADNNYTFIHRKKGKRLLVAKTLKEIDGNLSNPHFFRTHQSHLVNLQEIEKYVRGSGGYLVMSNGESVPVARSKKEELMRALHQR